jgi:hypothetical protein
MKNIVLSVILSCLGLTVLAQEKSTYELSLNDIEVHYNGTKESKATITKTLTAKGEQNISIYSKDGNTYFLNVRVLIRGNRIKLRMRNYLITQEGKTIKGKYRKYVHYLKVGVDNKFEGNGTESLLINAEKMLAIKAIYKFELIYIK